MIKNLLKSVVRMRGTRSPAFIIARTKAGEVSYFARTKAGVLSRQYLGRR
jgi:hypothetical protein